MNDVKIIGPCSAEENNFMSICDHLVGILGFDFIFKGSFDKANRTSVHGGRGEGLERSLDLFREVKRKYPKLNLTTDVHEVWQVEKISDCIDVVQIPAFLCKQTDLLVESARHFDVVNIKKGQWLGPEILIKMVDKVKSVNPDVQVWITDRGSNFGYDKLITDVSIVDELKTVYDKVILDCTHSTQRSRKVYGSQGDPSLAERHVVGSVVYNYDGMFVETHPDPQNSPSDGECMIHLDNIGSVLEYRSKVKTIIDGAKNNGRL
tara:strand:+ start:1769 stop:2557 length:789 start_codon:yes stop_codon:yes gene_type:complete